MSGDRTDVALTASTATGSATASARWVRHDLKVDQPYYEGLESGAKTFEVRLNDRHFQPGDVLVLHEGWRTENGVYHYTNRFCRRVITYVLRDYPALAEGYVVLAIKPEEETP